MKVIHISDVSKFGGIETLVSQLSEFQQRNQNIDASILSPFKQPDNFSWRPAVKVHFGDFASGFDFTPRKLKNAFRIFNANDIVHFHGFNLFLFLCAIAARKIIICTEHGTFQRDNQKNTLKNFIKKRVLGYFFLNHLVDYVVFNSYWLRSDVSLKTKKIKVIWNGIPQKESPKNRNHFGNKFVVLTVARFVKKKRIDRLISAFSKLPPDSGYFLDLVGNGPEFNALREMAEKLLPLGSYCFHGFQKNVESFYQGADLFVLPTYNEPFGLVVLESLKYQVPVICFSDAGGALEIISGLHKRTIVNNEKELVDAIEYWKDNPEEREKTGKLGSQLVRDKFSLERMADEYFEVYRETQANRSEQVGNSLIK